MSDDVEEKAVELLLANGRTVAGRFTLYDQAPGAPKEVRIELSFMGRQLAAQSVEGNFDALRKIRRQLEPERIFLLCYGASRTAYPSPMAFDMGGGEKAFRLQLGKKALMADLVWIFDAGPDVEPSTVEEQEAFNEEWHRSHRAEPEGGAGSE